MTGEERTDKDQDLRTGEVESPAADELTGLMGGTAKAPDLEQEALAAAEQALAEGRRVLAEADGELEEPPPRSGRERLLRLLLLCNLLLMVGVLLLPDPTAAPDPVPTGAAEETPAAPPAPAAARTDPWLQALEAADRGQFRVAIDHLERYLADSPRMAPGRRMLVYLTLEHYAAQLGDFTRAGEYQQRASALMQSHTLPDDLLAMARQAEERGDSEALRRVYARFLLQQRQIPASLYRHVAEAYLKLGDSYRLEASQAAEAARLRELEELRQRLQAEEQAPKERGR